MDEGTAEKGLAAAGGAVNDDFDLQQTDRGRCDGDLLNQSGCLRICAATYGQRYCNLSDAARAIPTCSAAQR